MARKVLYVDDLTGDVIDEGLGGPLEFSYDGKHYTIDLGVKSRDSFRKAIQPYIDAAEEVEAPRRRSAGGRQRKPSGSGRSPEELANIREWAKKNGHEVSPRGRIAAPILQAYDEAHAPSGQSS